MRVATLESPTWRARADPTGWACEPRTMVSRRLFMYVAFCVVVHPEDCDLYPILPGQDEIPHRGRARYAKTTPCPLRARATDSYFYGGIEC